MFFNFLQLYATWPYFNFYLLTLLLTHKFRLLPHFYLINRFQNVLNFFFIIKFNFINFKVIKLRKKLKLKKRKIQTITRYKTKIYRKKYIKLKLRKFLFFKIKLKKPRITDFLIRSTHKYFFKNFLISKENFYFLTHKKISYYSLFHFLTKKDTITKKNYLFRTNRDVLEYTASATTLKKTTLNSQLKNKKELNRTFDFLENNFLTSNKNRIFFFFETSFLKFQVLKDNKLEYAPVFFKIYKHFRNYKLRLHLFLNKKNTFVSNKILNIFVAKFFQKKIKFFKSSLKINKLFFRSTNLFTNQQLNKKKISIVTNKNYRSSPLLFKTFYKTTAMSSILFFSKWNSSFLGGSLAFLFLTIKEFSTTDIEQKIINYKKELFSFNMKNEAEKKILKKRIFLNSINYFANSETHSNTSFNFTYLKNLQINNSRPTFLGNILTNKIWNSLDVRQKYINLLNETDLDLMIKRIRFKPGYSIIWREARSVLKENLSLSLRYQWRLTNYLSKFKKTIKNKLFFIKNFTVLKLFIKTKFLPDADFSNFFILNGFVFLNANPCYNKNLQVFAGDCLQLTVSIKYYIFFKNLINEILMKQKKINFLIKKKKFVPTNYEEKQKSKNFPKSMLSLNNVLNVIPRYLEVDFFSLSCVVLFEPFLWNDLDYEGTLDIKWFVINMYNWKYIN